MFQILLTFYGIIFLIRANGFLVFKKWNLSSVANYESYNIDLSPLESKIQN